MGVVAEVTSSRCPRYRESPTCSTPTDLEDPQFPPFLYSLPLKVRSRQPYLMLTSCLKGNMGQSAPPWGTPNHRREPSQALTTDLGQRWNQTLWGPFRQDAPLPLRIRDL